MYLDNCIAAIGVVAPAVSLEAVLIIFAVEDSTGTVPSLAEFLQSQIDDNFCQAQVLSVGKANFTYDIDRHGLLVRRSRLDGPLKRLVLVAFLQHRLNLKHSPVTTGHPGTRRMYDTMRQALYGPHI